MADTNYCHFCCSTRKSVVWFKQQKTFFGRRRQRRPIAPRWAAGYPSAAVRNMSTYTYKVEQLFTDQDPDLVRSYIASLITWQDNKQYTTKCPVTYLIEQHGAGKATKHELIISWNIEILRMHNQYLDAEMKWLRQGGGPDGERRSEMAGMALGFIYASAVLKQRIVTINHFLAPDLLYDLNPHAQKGIEVVGRGTGGTNVLLKVRNHPKKFDAIAKNPKVAEAYLSLWCSKPAVSLWEQVK